MSAEVHRFRVDEDAATLKGVSGRHVVASVWRFRVDGDAATLKLRAFRLVASIRDENAEVLVGMATHGSYPRCDPGRHTLRYD